MTVLQVAPWSGDAYNRQWPDGVNPGILAGRGPHKGCSPPLPVAGGQVPFDETWLISALKAAMMKIFDEARGAAIAPTIHLDW
jgi:hypothetical protein